ncbi:MAG: ATP phosphoribosyltransferase [Campylobacterota bacterium]|nr:ATP phosphoribosyltransferase [Campylobacterota bacterium]
MNRLVVALSKGRLLDEALNIFAKKGIDVQSPQNGRKLYFDGWDGKLRFIIVRAQDVPTYVEYGAADLGIAGYDVLREQNRDLYELINLNMGRCKMIVAGKNSVISPLRPLRVATKFPNIAKDFFTKEGINVEIIKLYGSIELAPLFEISDWIVDITSTGRTLKENGLKVIREIFTSTAYLVASKGSYHTKYNEIKELMDILT